MTEESNRTLGIPTLNPHWIQSRILAGLMDKHHVEITIGDWLVTLSNEEKEEFWRKWENSQNYVKSLQESPPSTAIVNETDENLKALHEELKKREDISRSFAGSVTSIGLVDLSNVVAIQPSVQGHPDNVSLDQEWLRAYCLPLPKAPPCDVNVSFSPPIGNALFISDVPYMNSVSVDSKDGRLTVSPGVHVNFLQVNEFQGRSYLINGYHRAFSLLKAGVNIVPAWIVRGPPPQLLGAEFFNLGYLMNLKRQPFLSDFLTSASLDCRKRLRKYGIHLRLEIAPFNVPL